MKKLSKENLLAGFSLVAVTVLFLWFIFGSSVWQLVGMLALTAAIEGILFFIVTISPKRLLSFCMVCLIIAAMPLQALATEETIIGTASKAAAEFTEDREQEEPATKSTPKTAEESSEEDGDETKLADIREEIALVVEKYQLTPDMTDQDLANSYFMLDSDGVKEVWETADGLFAQAEELSLAEKLALSNDENTKICLRAYYIMVQISNPMLLAAGGTFNPSVGTEDGYITVEVSDGSDGNTSENNGVITIIDQSTYDTCNSSYTTQSVTIKITVDPGTKAKTFAFSWTADKWSSVKFDGVDEDETSNRYELSEVSGEKVIEINLTTDASSTDKCTFTLANFELKNVAETSNITIHYDNTLGNVIMSGTDGPFANGSNIDITKDTTFTASTTANGAVFLGWIDADDKRVGTNVSYTAAYKYGDQDLTAVFATTSPWFLVDGTYLINGLTEATSKGSNLILMNTAILLENTNYTIPNTDTLLIPNSDTDTGAFTGEPDIQVSTNPVSSPAKVFRTLTLPSSSTITCNGKINVNGHRSNNGQPFCGTAVSGYGKLILGAESKTFPNPEEKDLKTQLTIANGGELYCYGYITGSGMVEVAAGGIVHELLQMADWPGGSNAVSWRESDSKLFLMSQYYMQNIEAPFKIQYGGTVMCEAVITVSSTTYKKSVAYIGSSGLFQIKTNGGYILRIYDQSRDRMNYHMESGTFTFGSISITVGTWPMQVSLDSSETILPLTNNLSVYIGDDATFNMGNRSAILPGAEVIIEEGGIANLTNNLYIFDVADWKGTRLESDGTYSNIMFFNRTASAIKANSAPVGVNTTPQCNPLPYVATANGVSPAATTYFYYESKSYNQTNPKPITASGKLVVNGTLNVQSGGALYTTTGGTSANKAITGTGVIDYTAGTVGTAGSITVGTESYATTVNVGPAVAYLAGFDGLQNFGKYVYHGQENGYWYNYKVTAVDNFGNPAASAVTVTPEIAAGSDSSKSLIGYITYNAAGTQSAFNFTTNLLTVKNGDTTLTPADGVYSLTSINADTQLTLTRIIAGTSVRAGDCLDIYFWISGLGGKGYTAKFSDGKEVAFDDWTLDKASGMYRVVYNGIVAREMPETVSVAIYKDNVQVSETATESIEGYALRTLEKNDNTYLQTTLVDMLNYGAAAQTYFGHNVGNLANAELTTTQQGYGTQTEPNTVDDMKSITSTQYVSFAGANVTAGTTLYLSFYFNGITDANKSNFEAVLTYTDHYGDEITRTIAGSDFKLKDGYYGPQLTGLAVADGRKLVNCKIYNGEDLVAEAQSSIAGYAARTIANNADNTNLVNVCKNLIKFIDSAVVYFDSL